MITEIQSTSWNQALTVLTLHWKSINSKDDIIVKEVEKVIIVTLYRPHCYFGVKIRSKQKRNTPHLSIDVSFSR